MVTERLGVAVNPPARVDVYVADDVVPVVPIPAVAVVGVRCAIAFVPVAAKMDPAVDANPGAVANRLSRTLAFHCAAVKATLVTAVKGVVHAMVTALRSSVVPLPGAARQPAAPP